MADSQLSPATIDLDALERMAKAATKGPWLDYGAVLRQRYPAKAASATSDTNEVRCGTASPSEVVVFWTGFDGQPNARHNAAYIAAASPDVVLDLIAEVRRLREALDKAREWFIGHTTASDALDIINAALTPKEDGRGD